MHKTLHVAPNRQFASSRGIFSIGKIHPGVFLNTPKIHPFSKIHCIIQYSTYTVSDTVHQRPELRQACSEMLIEWSWQRRCTVFGVKNKLQCRRLFVGSRTSVLRVGSSRKPSGSKVSFFACSRPVRPPVAIAVLLRSRTSADTVQLRVRCRECIQRGVGHTFNRYPR